ncbi:MAG: hypothetical protein ACK55I_23930, partial [bacterium]
RESRGHGREGRVVVRLLEDRVRRGRVQAIGDVRAGDDLGVGETTRVDRGGQRRNACAVGDDELADGLHG